MASINRRSANTVVALGIAGIPFLACAQAQGPVPREFKAARENVKNRGNAPIAFLNELVDWGATAPDEIFAFKKNEGIYARVRPELGPWRGDRHRRAVMLEVLRVLGGFESAWDWQAGVDVTNPNSQTPCTEEAGIFQCSGDSMQFNPVLKTMLVQAGGDASCDTFRRVTKQNHVFAIEYCARLLRETVEHHGPVKGRHINPWLQRAAVEEFLSYL